MDQGCFWLSDGLFSGQGPLLPTKAADDRLMALVADIAREPGPVIPLCRGAAGSHAGEDANWPCDLASGFGEQLA